ncbi:monocarboxylate transporter 12-like [Anthonomus grandis grandis]|uniref:monocarboxylate transporter 12-like n=1 Tax=Anthonomus grandis grandis TaxID=2921223 RepID=UPI0021666608|nr:monocarboxylate transporter 12-like [Anthonomus grandis grandis]
MGEKVYKKITVDGVVYQIQPPDGGWGLLVALATTIIYICTVVPMAGFGTIFKDFLKKFGDETSNAALTNGLFNTVSFFTGLLATILLNKISFRKVALLGSMFHLIGTIGTIFATNMPQLITFLGIFQGMGFGLLLPAALSAFNAYFDEKLQMWMSISQTGMVIGYILMPPIAAWFIKALEFRGSLIFLAGLSALTVPAALILQPVKWHMKMTIHKETDKEIELSVINKQIEEEEEPLNKGERKVDKPTKPSLWQATKVSLSLLTDPKYLNLSIGLALCFTADIQFYPIIPLILGNVGFTSSQIALILSVYFGADLVARICMSIISIFVKYQCRRLFYWGALFSALLRIVWLLNDNFWYKITVMAVLGVLRCFIETLVSLVISEAYPDKFSSAFSLYMFVNGFTCLICGFLMSGVKDYTHSDTMVCHVLTAAFAISVISWTIEMFILRKKNKK